MATDLVLRLVCEVHLNRIAMTPIEFEKPCEAALRISHST